jgi:hypothetical protein
LKFANGAKRAIMSGKNPLHRDESGSKLPSDRNMFV